MSKRMAINILAVFLLTILVLWGLNYFYKGPVPNLKLEELRNEFAIRDTSSVDHRMFVELQKNFESPQEVTIACLSCHNGTHREVMASNHWNWQRVAYVEGRGIRTIGKKNILNNFCIGAESNEQACSKCHIGFGMTDDQFDFTNQRNVDCMVCHDNSEEYIKGASMSGYPDRKVNLTKVAQSVGPPSKINCGACHFYSGGGNNVKHGDLEDALLASTREIDVHMATNGMDMLCIDCHKTEYHNISGRLYSVSSNNINRATCEECHSSVPHLDDMLNKHNAKVSCQTCHIPVYAKENPTKMSWKWSDAGKLKDGQPYEVEDSLGQHSYMSIKGSFVWEKNVIPDYMWFNGTADHYLLGDTIVVEKPVVLNQLNGSHSDPGSKIIPVKIHIGDQIYDKKYKMLIQPKLFSSQPGDGGYWTEFDWGKAAAAGMKTIGLPYSGEYGFIETIMYWPVNHMVSPAEEAVQCAECHNSTQSRIASLNDFYLPGRDRNFWLDGFAKIGIILALMGVVIHGAARFVTNTVKIETAASPDEDSQPDENKTDD